MSNPNAPSNGALIRTLGGISALSGLLIVMVVEYTAPIIEQNRKEAIERAIFEVVPGAIISQPYLLGENSLTANDGTATEGELIYAGYDEKGKLKGIALATEGQGYQDVIQILYGYNPACECLSGMKVLKHAETPGLGDLILKDPPFLANFTTLDVKLNPAQEQIVNPVVTVKHGSKQNPWEIDSISGATVSSKAIGKMIRLHTASILPRLYPLTETIKEHTP
ncbi:MAG: FMN-binding protein [Gammaproteobacteria bacterium]|jgi:electron transport complex protein RnfG|nr:FMN-binding protein [Gammaproteobacteria bacterium]MBT4607573.1 FMN-binding protein [Thiotrichales bacterium]MBT3473681.1 FMN-binding protein [Gammaproteobacteria bacterium]MBT3967017.1 FMN-binding protein [Gammaproteobacteria bacterium]MBT4079360.1 FMN-binding protein [Gammaproteobacteria bacterium]